MRDALMAGALVALCACAPVKEQTFRVDNLQPGEGKVIDAKSDKWPWSHDHPMVVYRDPLREGGRTHVVVENASEAGLTAAEDLVSDPASSAASHFTWGP